ncbi:hypothetical protein JCM11641_000864 [Rhodosporidiobolus odoratus]
MPPRPPPLHLESDPSAGTRSVHIHAWTVTSTKLPILSIPQADALSTDLDLALPEIIFGNNSLRLCHDPTGFEIKWDANAMLSEVKKGEGWEDRPGAGPVRVKHADEWKRGQASSTSSTASLTVQKPFDWTYTTLHRGSFTLPSPSPSSSPPSQPAPAPTFSPAPPSHPGIPLTQLARTDIPILFFDEIPLFEDELGDNGIADATVRIRVNHTSLFLLSRFSLRIDGVLFRQFDIRLFHSFGSSEIIRETKGREASYEAVRDRVLGPRVNPAGGGGGGGGGRTASPAGGAAAGIRLPNRTPFATIPSRSPLASPSHNGGTDSPGTTTQPAEDLSKLNDINLVAGVLEQLALEEEVGGVSLERGREASKEGWEGLGRRLEVMRVPWAKE